MSIYVESPTFAEGYRDLLETVLRHPDHTSRPRDMEVRELISPTLRVLNPYSRIYTSRARSTPMRYLAGEFCWYFGMMNDAGFISRYSAFWNQIRNVDTAVAGQDDMMAPGQVNSSYGHLLMAVRDAEWQGQPISQLAWVIKSLERDRDSRQAIAHINRPTHQKDWVRDFPCTMSLQFFIRDGQLHLVVHMRSNDLIMGLTFDFPMFSFFQEVVVDSLLALGVTVEMGHLTLIAGSSHIYDRHYGIVEDMVDDGIQPGGLFRPLSDMPVKFDPNRLSFGQTRTLIDLIAVDSTRIVPEYFTTHPWYDTMARAMLKEAK